MSEEQEWKERGKAIKGLLARLKRWWEILPTSFEIFIGFCIILGVATLIWFTIGPEYAKFVTYLFGGLLVLFQIMASARRATAAENTAKAMQKTAQSTEKGNIDERFKNAIEHLGHESTSIRLGGIYALHNIAQEVEEYRERVFEILCAHIRETTTQEAYKPRITGTVSEEPTIEIQSILDLLFVKTPGREIYKGFKANLERANLKGVQLFKAYLRNVNFSYAILDSANLSRADLQKAILFQVNLHNAILEFSDLQEVYLRWSILQYAILSDAKLLAADLRGAKLQGVYLKGANLQEADLKRVNLEEANLQDANLQDADLQGADLINARYLKVEQLLNIKTLYKAKLPEGMEDIIRQQKPTLFEEPSDEDDA